MTHRVVANRYHVLDTIASGYQATVYHAVDTYENKDCALKVMSHPKLLINEKKVQQLWEEVEANKKIWGHRHIMCAQAFWPHVDWPVAQDPTKRLAVSMLVMPLAQNGELFDYLAQSAFPLPIAKSFFTMILDAVAFAHAKGVSHRDLKPDNVLIGAEYEPLISDWGMSAVIHETPSAHGWPARTTPLGTNGYMAPEVYAGGPYQPPAADMWSLGVLLFVMLSGAPPLNKPIMKDWWFARIHSNQWDLFWTSHEQRIRFDPDTKEMIESLLNVHPHGRPSAAKLLQCSWLQNGPLATHQQIAEYLAGQQLRFTRHKVVLRSPRELYQRPNLVSVPVWDAQGAGTGVSGGSTLQGQNHQQAGSTASAASTFTPTAGGPGRHPGGGTMAGPGGNGSGGVPTAGSSGTITAASAGSTGTPTSGGTAGHSVFTAPGWVMQPGSNNSGHVTQMPPSHSLSTGPAPSALPAMQAMPSDPGSTGLSVAHFDVSSLGPRSVTGLEEGGLSARSGGSYVHGHGHGQEGVSGQVQQMTGRIVTSSAAAAPGSALARVLADGVFIPTPTPIGPRPKYVTDIDYEARSADEGVEGGAAVAAAATAAQHLPAFAAMPSPAVMPETNSVPMLPPAWTAAAPAILAAASAAATPSLPDLEKDAAGKTKDIVAPPSAQGGAASGPVSASQVLPFASSIGGSVPAGQMGGVQAEAQTTSPFVQPVEAMAATWAAPTDAVPVDILQLPTHVNGWFVVAGGKLWADLSGAHLPKDTANIHATTTGGKGEAPAACEPVATAHDLFLAIARAAQEVAPGCSVQAKVVCVSWPGMPESSGQHGNDTREERFAVKIKIRAIIATQKQIEYAADVAAANECFSEVKLTFRVYNVPFDLIRPIKDKIREANNVTDRALGTSGVAQPAPPASHESDTDLDLHEMPGFVVTVTRKAGDSYIANCLLNPIMDRIGSMLC